MNIILSNVAIREHNGLYSINDLHRASGGEKRHQPSDWLRLKQTIELRKPRKREIPLSFQNKDLALLLVKN